MQRDNNKYKNTRKYCARSLTIEDSVKKTGLTILDSCSKDSKIWTARSANKESLQTNQNKLGINDASDGEKIKNGCEKINKMKDMKKFIKLTFLFVQDKKKTNNIAI